eukprot:scaffold4409_cov369-Prasinococcus_capsulatus_cf.AAC.31
MGVCSIEDAIRLGRNPLAEIPGACTTVTTQRLQQLGTNEDTGKAIMDSRSARTLTHGADYNRQH